jgi:hypothetical protein
MSTVMNSKILLIRFTISPKRFDRYYLITDIRRHHNRITCYFSHSILCGFVMIACDYVFYVFMKRDKRKRYIAFYYGLIAYHINYCYSWEMLVICIFVFTTYNLVVLWKILIYWHR